MSRLDLHPAKLSGKRRSSQWPRLRREVITSVGKCELCGGRKSLVPHHIKPFHLFPELELERDNLVVLCEAERFGINCHLFAGHIGDFKAYNPVVLATVAQMREMLLARRRFVGSRS